MDIGSHFKLNEESSQLQKRIIVFDYLRISSGKGSVQLNFSREGVRFNLHQTEEGQYFSGCILFLPMTLDKDFRTELTTTLNSVWTTHLNGLKAESYPSSTGEMYYRSEAFRGGCEDSFLARLLLDFMFEMEHGTVFKHDPLYETIYSTLHEHLLYSAIVQKADYDFYKRSCTQADLNYLVRAERRWVEILTSEPLDLVFHESPWFDEPVEELMEVYKDDECTLEKVAGEPKVKQTANIAAKWFMAKYRPDGVLCIKHGKRYKWRMWELIAVLFCLVGVCISHAVYADWTVLGRPELCVFRSLLPSLLLVFVFLVFIHRRKINPFTLGMSILMPRLFAGIAAGWMTIGLGDIWAAIAEPKGPMFAYHSLMWPVAVGVSLFLLVFLAYSVRRIQPFLKKVPTLLISACLGAISFVYSILIGGLLFRLYGGGASMLWNSKNPRDIQTLMVFSFAAMFVGIFIQLLFQEKSISSSED